MRPTMFFGVFAYNPPNMDLFHGKWVKKHVFPHFWTLEAIMDPQLTPILGFLGVFRPFWGVLGSCEKIPILAPFFMNGPSSAPWYDFVSSKIHTKKVIYHF